MLTSVQTFLVAIISQALFYGIYIATTIQCFRWLMFTDDGWKPREKVNSFSNAFATVFIFLSSTTNLVVGLRVMLDLGKMKYNHGFAMAMDISEVLAIISIDGALIHRCWIVYGKSWRVICVPIFFWSASLACSALFSYYGKLALSAANGQIYLLNAQICGNALTGLYVCNIAITIYATTAIIYRIRSTTKISGSNSKRLDYIMRILAESGILYTSMTVFCLVGSVIASSNDSTWVEKVIYNISDVLNFSMAGISFNLILIRVYHRRVELRNSMEDSRNIDGERSLSDLQFNNRQITAPPEGPSSNVLDQAIDEIQEHRRNGMHEN